MQHEPAAKLRGPVGLILLVAAAAAIWWGLDRSEPRADWLHVEAPRRAVAGQPLPVRVHLSPRAEAGYLCADLHWGTSRDSSKGCLASGGSKAVAKEGGTFDFAIMVAPAQGLRFVTGIIYLSPTGSWTDHTLMATTEVIPVTPNAVGQADLPLEPLRLRPPGDDPTLHPHPAAIPRWLTAVLFLAATVLAWGAGQSPAGAGGLPGLRDPDPGKLGGSAVDPSPALKGTLSPSDGERDGVRGRTSIPRSTAIQPRESGAVGPDRHWWRVLAVLLALACLWEFLGLESWLGAHARAMARAGDFYYPRAVFQKVVISITVAALAAFLIFVQRARSSRRLLLAGFGLYLGISVVNLVSLHAIDQIADLSWRGLSLVQALKLGCAAMTLGGVFVAGRKPTGNAL